MSKTASKISAGLAGFTHRSAKPTRLMSSTSYLALEKRIVFDGALAATAAEAFHKAADAGHGADTHASDPLHAGAENAAAQLPALIKDTQAPTPPTPHEIAFVDSALADVKTLLKSIGATVEIVMIDAAKDGIDQMANTLAGRRDISAIHILSHGSEANLTLGTSDLNAGSMLTRYASDLAVIKGALRANADILIYGCNFARGADGDAAAQELAALTGANVAASTDLTGAASHGGNWVLEEQIGAIHTSAISAFDWNGELIAAKTATATGFTFTTGTTAVNLVNTITKGSAGITVLAGSQAVTNGGGVFAGTFTTVNPTFGYSDGVVISTGDIRALNASDPGGALAAGFTGATGAAYTSGGYESPGGYLANTAGSGVSFGTGQFDGVSIDFSFTAQTTKIALGALFGSTEYYTYVGSAFFDSYSVLLSGPKPGGGNYSGQDIALVPGTANTPVTINTINNTLNATLNRDNTLASSTLKDLALDGITTPLDTVFTVTKGATYAIKFRITDQGDSQLDSAAFINFFGASLLVDLDAANKTAAGTGYAGTFTEKGAAVAIVNTDATITNYDKSTSLQKATVALTNAQAGDSLSLGSLAGLGITGTLDNSVAGKISVNLSGAASAANYDAALKAIAFANSSGNPSTTDRNITVTLNDGQADSNAAVSTIHVAAVNDAPVEVVPGAKAIVSGAKLAIPGLSVSDVDANGGLESVTLSVAHGTLSLASTSGLTFMTGSGTNDATIAFTGTLADINAGIAGLSYKPTANYSGADTLTFKTNDNGNTGGVAQTTTQTVAIDVLPAPIAVADSFTTVHDTAVVVTPLANDTDANGYALSLTEINGIAIKAGDPALAVSGGTLTLDATGQITFTPTAGTFGTPSFTYTVGDGHGGSATGTVSGTVYGPPVAVDDTVAAVPAKTTNVKVLANDSDPAGYLLSITAINGAAVSVGVPLTLASGTIVTLNADGTIDARPLANTFGPESFTYTIADGHTGTATGHVTLSEIPQAAPVVDLPGAIAQTSRFVYGHGGTAAGSPSWKNPEGLARFSAVGDEVAGSGLSISYASQSHADVTGVAGATLADAVANNSYISMTFSTLASIPQTWLQNTAKYNAYGTSYQFALAISSDGFTSGTLLSQNNPYVGGAPYLDGNSSYPLAATANYQLQGGQTYELRAYIYNVAGGKSATINWDDLYVVYSANPSNYTATFTEKQPAVAIAAASAQILDVDSANLSGANIVLSNEQAADRLLIGGTLLSDGATGTRNGIGYSVADTGATITITLTGPASKAAYASTIAAISFNNTSLNPSVADRIVNVTVTDDAGLVSKSAVATIHVIPVNDPPALALDTTGTGTGYTTTFSEAGAAVATANPLATALTDVDNASMASASVVLTNKLAGDQLSVGGSAVSAGSTGTIFGIAYTVVDVGGKETIQLTGPATKAAYAQALDAITFSNSSVNPASADRIITTTVNDGVSASNSALTTIHVVDLPPSAAGSLAAVTTTDGHAGLSIATASGFTDPSGAPFTFTASGLPAGLSIDALSGLITGTIAHDASKSAPATTGSGASLDGKYTVTVTGKDAAGRMALQTFTIDSTNQAPIAGTATAPLPVGAGQTITPLDARPAFTDPNTGDILSFSATGLPPGLSINPTTGQITGTITATASHSGPYTVKVTATDDKGASATESFTWVVTNTPPVIAAALPATSANDSATVAIATAPGFTDPVGLPLTYAASGLPKGLTIDPGTGIISGTIDHDASLHAPAGGYPVNVTVNDGQGGTASQTFLITTFNQAPVVSALTPTQTSNDGAAVVLGLAGAFTDPNAGDTLTFAATGLPTGLMIDPHTGVISGTIDPSASKAGPATVTVTATDDKGLATTEAFTWVVSTIVPVSTPVANQAANDGAAVTVNAGASFTDPLALPLAFSATGLPKGLLIDSKSGIISGIIDHDASKAAPGGVYAVTVTASDGQGGATAQSFNITAANQAPVVAAKTPAQTTRDGAFVALSVAGAFTDPNSGDVLKYTATGLPKGLSLDPKSGVISGTVDPSASKAGPYSVTVTATDDKGLSISETIPFTVNNAPPVSTAIPAQAVNDGQAFALAAGATFTDPLKLPLAFSASGLPKGLTLDAKTGTITGAIDHDASAAILGGVYTVTITADDGQGGATAQTFTITAHNQAPIVSTPTSGQTNSNGDTVTLKTAGAFIDPNPGDVLTYKAMGLPMGLSIDAKTGLISGTVDKAASASGPYAVKVTATDGKGSATAETFAWTIKPVPPGAAAPVANQNVDDGQAVTLAMGANFLGPLGPPLTYAVTGLPKGLSINPTTGLISGTIDHDASAGGQGGVYAVTVTAKDGLGGAIAKTFAITAQNQAPFLIAQTPSQSSSAGASVALSIAGAFKEPNAGDIVSYAALGLPKGLGIDAKTGVISGIIDKSVPVNGPYTVVITATDDKGLATPETFTWVVNDAAPTSTTVASQSVKDGLPVNVNAGASFSDPLALPLTFSATGLPKGLTIDPVTGIISGTIAHDASLAAPGGVYAVTVTASDGQDGTTSQVFTIASANQAPANAAPTPDQTAANGASISLDAAKAFTDPNTGDVVTYTATGLPKGLSIDPLTGLITGIIDPSASAGGPYAVTVIATDDKGLATPEAFTFSVTNVAPTSSPLANKLVSDGQAVSLPVAASFADPLGLPLAYTAAGLPKGLSLDPKTGLISGTVDHDASASAPGGVYAVAVTASDGQGGSTAQTFAITAANHAPVVAAKTPAQTAANGATVALSVAGAFHDPNAGDIVTYAAAGLPKGLSIDAKSGLITGTIDNAASLNGPYPVTVTATDDKGLATTETFAFTVNAVPPFASPALPSQAVLDSQTLTLDAAKGFQNPLGSTLAFNATGLPKGLTIDLVTGVISGTIDHDASAAVPGGLYTIAVTASDGQGGTAVNTFTITAADQAPNIVATTPGQSSTDGATVSLNASAAFMDPNAGDTLTFAATGLPKGLSIDPKSGLVTGTIAPTGSKTGPYTVAITATDDKGLAATETFTWTVTDVPPTSTALLSQTVKDGQPVAIAAGVAFTDTNGLPLTFSATGLPKGLVIDPATGTISGTIDHDASALTPGGGYAVKITASDGQGGTTSQSFTIMSSNQAPLLTAQTLPQVSSNGDPVSLSIAAAFKDLNAGDIVTFAAAGLPKGLAMDPKTGIIAGTIDPAAAESGPYSVTVTATDAKGLSSAETFLWTVKTVPLNSAVTIPGQSVLDSQPFSLPTAQGFVAPAGLTLSHSANGLPLGLSIDAKTGLITGTIDHDASAAKPGGVYAVTVTALDSLGGLVQQTFAITALNQAPVLAAPTPGQTSTNGAAVAFSVAGAFLDPNAGDSLTFTQTGLPTGLTIDNAGLITGTIAPTASKSGPATVSVTATDDKGLATTQTFLFTVNDVPPVVVASIPNAIVNDGQPVSVATGPAFSDPLGQPLTFSASGLPKGTAIDPTTGLVSGTIDHSASITAPGGVYIVTVTAADGQGGTVAQVFTLQSVNLAPAVSSLTPGQTSADGGAVSFDASAAFKDPNAGDVLTFTATGLPKGLAIDPATGLITGTIDPSASLKGPYSVTITATDTKGLSTPETFTWTVANIAPVAGIPLASIALADGAAHVALPTAPGFIDPLGLPLSYAASGLPAGLSIDAKTGIISGSLDHNASAAVNGGLYTVSVTAADGQGGTATNAFVLTALDQAPAIAAAGLTPDQASKTGATVSLDASAAFKDPNSGDIVTFAATGLPKGLVIDPSSGLITGTIDPSASANGPYTVTVTATDGKGLAATETFQWTVANVPPASTATPLLPQTVTDGLAAAIPTAQAFTDPLGLALTFSATGLPKGLVIDPSSGVITGTIGHDASLAGPYAVTVTAADGQGGATSQVLTLTAKNLAPAIVAPTATQTGVNGASVTLDTGSAFKDANPGDSLSFSAANLPKGLVIDAKSGVVSGTIDPSASLKGASTVSVTATDDKGLAATETFTFAVANVPPAANLLLPQAAVAPQTVTDGLPAAFNAGAAFADPLGLPLTFSATGLPKGLAIDPKTGVIAGTVDHDASNAGPYTVTVTASDGQGGSTSIIFPIIPLNQAPTIVAATPNQTSPDGAAVALDVSAAFSDPNIKDTLTYAATGLPPGLAIDAKSGLVWGTIYKSANLTSPFSVEITATDDKGHYTTEDFTWVVKDVPPVSTPIAAQIVTDGLPAKIAAGAVFADPLGLPLTFSVTGLPKGLILDPKTGLIDGIVDHDASKSGPYTVTVTADDSQGGTSTQSFTLTSLNEAPALVAKTPDQTSPDGAAVKLDASAAFQDKNIGDIISFAATNLPQGLVIDKATGLITGTIAVFANVKAPYPVSVTATDDKGASLSETFTWIVNDVPPVKSTITIADTAIGDGSTLTLPTAPAFKDPLGLPLTFTATGLPKGLTIDPKTGLISGTVDAIASQAAPLLAKGAGVYPVTVTADDGQGGTLSQTFTITALNVAPTANADLGTVQAYHTGNFSPLANDTSIEHNPLAIVAAKAPHGSVTLNGDGTLSYAPDAGFSGPDVIAYTIADGHGGFATSTIAVTVTPGSTFLVNAAQPKQQAPASAAPAFAPAPAIAEGGIVGSTVESVDGGAGSAGSISAEHAVASAVNKVVSLKSLGELHATSGTLASATAGLGGSAHGFKGSHAGAHHASTTYAPQGLTGFSLVFGQPAHDGAQPADGTITVESLVHEHTYYMHMHSVLGGIGKTATSQPVSYTVTLADGSPLPAWLSSPAPGLLIGERPADAEHLSLSITATFKDGHAIKQSVTIDMQSGKIKPFAGKHSGLVPPLLFSKQLAAESHSHRPDTRHLALLLAG